jgi:hypothetical protein
MQFLKDLFHWFLTGATADIEQPVPEEQQKPSIKQDKKDKVKPVLDVVGAILSEGRRDDFLNELKSIKPITKQFDKDHAELVQEVKRLSRKRT